ncbi:hypothetical protein L3Y34_015192 [Caenorhabditis briggsae]|uniref:Uncharacterized protein n=2 Tax=Caenorhabditis briggsae TaxID=6238 RepID=A0AAE9DUH4_CAEBR|nr:hypothetical protein L3Y34_015192 [Caenorhabditis briggsae]
MIVVKKMIHVDSDDLFKENAESMNYTGKQVQNVSYWHIQNYDLTNSYMVAQMWIDTNAKIGSTFQVTVSEDGFSAEFLEHFNERIVSKSEKRIRIRTNNPDRHIILERGLDDVITLTFWLQFYCLIVTFAEMEEPEYDDDFQKWMYEQNPKVYHLYLNNFVDNIIV